MQRLQLCATVMLIGAVFVAVTNTGYAGLVYSDPAEGWTYTYTGDQALGGDPDGTQGYNALDQTWSHENGSDEWDRTAIGAGSPGGATIYSEGGTNFLRVQDTGDPRDYGMGDPSNRKLYFGHSITTDIGVAGDTILDDGVTISFRARIATAPPPLDDTHPDGGGGTYAWPITGDGYVIHDGGKDCFGVRQSAGDKLVSFAMAISSDHSALGGKEGLVMNNLNGTTRSADVDTGEAGTLNLLELDPLEWHEFWITIESDPTATGTHLARIYMDGSLVSSDFKLTAGDGNDYDDSYIAMGVGSTGQSGAFDVDFFSYKPGVIIPELTSPSLFWDEQGDGDWDQTPSTQWKHKDGSYVVPPLYYPTADWAAVVAADTVTVAADHEAAALSVADGGAIWIEQDSTLNVTGSVNFADGTGLILEPGATLAAGLGGQLADVVLEGGGTFTIDTGADMTAAGIEDDGVNPAVLVKKGAGTLSPVASNCYLDVTTLQVEAGELHMAGDDPLAGATNVILKGGRLTVHDTGESQKADTLAEWWFAGTFNDAQVGRDSDFDDDLTLLNGIPVDRKGPGLDEALDFQGADMSRRGGYIFNNSVANPDDPNQVGMVIHGTLTVAAGGPVEPGELLFFGLDSDDRSTAWFDMDGDGDFERKALPLDPSEEITTDTAGGTPLMEVNNLQQVCYAPAVEGDYKVAFGFQEGGGGEYIRAKWWAGTQQELVDAGTPDPWAADRQNFFDNVMHWVDPSDQAQAGLWKGVVPDHLDLSAVSLSVQAPGSELHLVGTTGNPTLVGNLIMEQTGVLTTSMSNIVSSIVFGQTTIPASATPHDVGFDPQVATDVGKITGDDGTEIRISKLGSGTLVLDEDNDGLLSTTFRVAGGELRMVGLEAFGGATKMELDAGTFTIEGIQPVVGDPGTGPGGEIGRWTFDNVVGITVHNEGTAGDPLDGTLNGDADIDDQEGVVGDSLVMAGNGYVDLGNDAALNFSTNDWSISAWVKSTNTGTGDAGKGTIFANGGDTAGGIRYTLAVSENNEGAVTLTIDDDANPPGSSYDKEQARGSTLVNDGPWHHVVGVRDGGEIRVYVDGLLDDAEAINSAYDLTGIDQHNAYLGAITDHEDPPNPSPLYKFFQGHIDEVYLYDKALSQADIGSLYGAEPLDLTTHSVKVTGSSTLNVDYPAVVNFGPLTMTDGGILATTGAAMSFHRAAPEDPADTTIDGGAQAVGFNPGVDTDLGVINGSDANVVISKYGPLDLVLDKTNIGLDYATFDVQGGRLIGVPSSNPFGAAALRINGGEIVLAGKQGEATADYSANAVVVQSSGTLTAGSGGVGSTDPVAVTLGSSPVPDNGMSINAGATVLLRTTDDYTLNVAGNVSGAGNVNLSEGTVSFTGPNTYAGDTQVDGGMLVAASDTALGGTAAGTTLAAGATLAFEGGVSVGAESLTIEGAGLGGTIQNLSGDNVFAGDIQVLPTPAIAGTYALLDIGETGQRVEPGGIGLSGTGDDQNNNVYNGLTSDTGDTFNVTITNLDQSGAAVDNLDWRDRGDGSNDPLVALGEDHIKNNLGIVRVTLQDLPAGTYNATSYHVDAENTQCEAIKVFVDTGAGFVDTGVLGNANFDFGDVGGLTTPGIIATQAQFSFDANGTNDVLIVFDGTQAADDEVPVSGLLVEIPPGPPGPGSATISADEGTLTLTGAINLNLITLTFSGAGDIVHEGNIVDAGGSSVVKTGLGTLTLAGDNNYTDGTEVAEGTLLVNNTSGSGTGSGYVEVLPGATLGGSGTVAGDVGIEGIVSPGNSVGTLTVGGELEMIEATYICEIDHTGADRVHNAGQDGVIILGEEEEGGALELLVLESLGVPGCYTDAILSTSETGVIEGDFAQKPAEGDYLDYGVFLDGYEIVDTGAGFNYNLNLFQADVGDTDGDGDVDLDDLSALDDGWDPAASDKIWKEGDFDLDGDVDLDDLSALDDHWNPGGYPVVNCPFAGGGAGAGAAAVPEPGTFALLAMGLLALLLWRRYRRPTV